jgi:hypothetical protein
MEKYRGYTITYKCGFYWTLGTCFKVLKEATNEIDKLL